VECNNLLKYFWFHLVFSLAAPTVSCNIVTKYKVTDINCQHFVDSDINLLCITVTCMLHTVSHDFALVHIT